jgi:hypothetical protein
MSDVDGLKKVKYILDQLRKMPKKDWDRQAAGH